MTIALVGAGSMTAAALIPMLLEETDAKIHLISGKEVESHDERISVTQLDVLNKTALKADVLSIMPQVIVNCVALTNVDSCETERNLAWQLNVGLVENLARLSRVTDAHLIHMSTDYVFDGIKGPYSETDVPQPINYYGKTKLAGENACLSAGSDATVIRTNVLYSPSASHVDFVRWVLTKLESGEQINVVTDQYSNPTYVDDVAEAIVRIILRKRSGLYHVAGADYMSRFEFAMKIAEFFKLDPKPITAITTAELHQPARRPLRAGLVTIRAESDLRMKMRGIESGLTSLRHALFARAIGSTSKRV